MLVGQEQRKTGKTLQKHQFELVHWYKGCYYIDVLLNVPAVFGKILSSSKRQKQRILMFDIFA